MIRGHKGVTWFLEAVVLIVLPWDSAGPSFAQSKQHKTSMSAEAQAHIKIGEELLLHKKQYDDAVAEFQKAVELAPNSAEAHGYLGWGLFSRGLATRQFDDAIQELKKSIALDPNLASAYINLGGAFDLSGRRQEAVDAYRKAAELRPTDSSGWEVVGLALVQMKQYDEAILEFRKASALAPKSVTPYVHIGMALIQKGDLDEAIPVFEKAAAMSPSVAVLFDLGGALQQNGKYVEAIAAFRKAVTVMPNYAPCHYALAQALEKSGQTREADQQFKEAYRLDPSLKSKPQMGWDVSGFAIPRNR